MDEIRSAVSSRIEGEISVQEIVGSNEVMVSTELRSEAELNEARKTMMDTLVANFGQPGGKPDFNNAGQTVIADVLRDPLQNSGAALSEQQLQSLAGAMRESRDTPPRSGLLHSFDELSELEAYHRK